MVEHSHVTKKPYSINFPLCCIYRSSLCYINPTFVFTRPPPKFLNTCPRLLLTCWFCNLRKASMTCLALKGFFSSLGPSNKYLSPEPSIRRLLGRPFSS